MVRLRSLFWLWVMFLLLCLVTDSASYWIVRSRLSQGLELALDASLVAGIVEEDLIRGRQLARTDRAEAAARDILMKNLQGTLATGLVFQFDLSGEKEQIWAEGQAKAEYPFLLGALVGRGRREITVNRKLRYLGSYK